MKLLQIKELILEAGSDSLAVFGGKFVGGYHLQQQPDEFAELIKYLLDAKPKFDNYLEIGAAGGGTIKFIADTLKPGAIYYVDNNRHPRHRDRASLLKDTPTTSFIGNSHFQECRDALKGWGIKFDLIMVDGDHSYRGLELDLEVISPHRKPGCYIILHDTVSFPKTVGKMFKELVSNSKEYEYVAEFIGKEKPKGIGLLRYVGSTL